MTDLKGRPGLVKARVKASCLAATLAAASLCPGIHAAYAEASSTDASSPRLRAPLVLEQSIPIPGVPLWIYSDVLSLDLKKGRVFATPQGAKAVAVVDMRAGKLLKMIPGMEKLQGVYYHEATERLFVVDGKAGALKVFNGGDYSQIATVKLAPGADAIGFDPKSNLLYIANGGEDAGMEHAQISAVDPVKLEKLFDITISAPGLEGLVIDSKNERLYVSLVDNAAVGVVDLRSKRQVATWKLTGDKPYPFALAVDGVRNQLYVTSRDDMEGFAIDGSLYVFDTNSGRVKRRIKIGGWADNVFVDQKRSRLYVVTGVGRIETYSLKDSAAYSLLGSVDTPLISKHGLFSPELDRLFINVPNVSRAGARVLIFKPAS